MHNFHGVHKRKAVCSSQWQFQNWKSSHLKNLFENPRNRSRNLCLFFAKGINSYIFSLPMSWVLETYAVIDLSLAHRKRLNEDRAGDGKIHQISLIKAWTLKIINRDKNISIKAPSFSCWKLGIKIESPYFSLFSLKLCNFFLPVNERKRSSTSVLVSQLRFVCVSHLAMGSAFPFLSDNNSHLCRHWEINLNVEVDKGK